MYFVANVEKEFILDDDDGVGGRHDGECLSVPTAASPSLPGAHSMRRQSGVDA